MSLSLYRQPQLSFHRYRHTHGYQEEPPVQFVNPSDQELEDHCVTEHEAAWSNLRNPDAE